jgi:hypothetical protein
MILTIVIDYLLRSAVQSNGRSMSSLCMDTTPSVLLTWPHVTHHGVPIIISECQISIHLILIFLFFLISIFIDFFTSNNHFLYPLLMSVFFPLDDVFLQSIL